MIWAKDSNFMWVQKYKAREVGKVLGIVRGLVGGLIDAVNAAFIAGSDLTADTRT